ncbi:MAG: helix-turn-helix transcriptional regulator [Clostridiales bacterium]|nr:helix-turn-helix transcriptional regulator [Clostridiales bacterium]
MAKSFNDRIADLLKEKKMTQKELSEIVGVTTASMSHYVKGDRVPRAAVMASIAQALGTTTDFIVYGESNDSKAEIDQAVRLIARNADHISREDKLKIVEILLREKRS